MLFILATTELHKLPATIISRCQRFDFRRIGIADITKRLCYIAKCENIVLEDAAAERIARLAEGGMRDAVSLLELCAGGGCDVTEEHVRDVLGVSGYACLCDTAEAVAAGDMKSIFAIVNGIAESKDITVFWQELLSFWRDMLVCKYADDFMSYLDITESEADMLSKAASGFSLGALVYQSGVMDDAMRAMIRSPQTKRITAELAFVKMCKPAASSSPEALMARVSELEDRLSLMEAGVISTKVVAANSSSGSPDSALIEDGSDISESDVSEGSTPSNNSDASAEVDENEAVTGKAEAVFSPVPDMSGIIEKLMKTTPMAVDFLRSAQTEISADGSKIRVIPENELAMNMLSGKDVINAVEQAFLLCGVCNSLPSVTVEKPVKRRRTSPADDLFGV